MKKIESGFSLIELLVVVAIIGILAAVGTVGYGNYIKSSKEKSVTANVANIASAISTFDAAVGAGVETGVNLSSFVTSKLTTFKNPYDSAPAATIFDADGTPADCTLTASKGVISLVKTNATTVTITGCYDGTVGVTQTATISASAW